MGTYEPRRRSLGQQAQVIFVFKARLIPLLVLNRARKVCGEIQTIVTDLQCTCNTSSGIAIKIVTPAVAVSSGFYSDDRIQLLQDYAPPSTRRCCWATLRLSYQKVTLISDRQLRMWYLGKNGILQCLEH